MPETTESVLFAALADITDGRDLTDTLERILGHAQDMTHARYAALAVLDEQGRVARFLTKGIGDLERARIGALPLGRGLIGHLLQVDAQLLNIQNMAAHPAAVGFPAHHPAMKSLLGAPIASGHQPIGALYLADGNFDAAAATRVAGLADTAAAAIKNAQAIEALRRRELGQQTIGALTQAALTGQDIESLFPDICATGRVVADADLAVLSVELDDATCFLSSSEGVRKLSHPKQVLDLPLLGQGPAGELILADTSLTFSDTSYPFRVMFPFDHGRAEIGFLTLLFLEQPPLDLVKLADEFVQQAIGALALAEERKLADEVREWQERDRIARDLHDTVTQRIFSVGLRLQAALADAPRLAKTVEEVIPELDNVMSEIRSTIYELRQPSEQLAHVVQAEVAAAGDLGFAVEVHTDPGCATISGGLLHDVRAVTSECLSNIAKHSGADHASVSVNCTAEHLQVVVRDNGNGRKPERMSGLANLTARASARGGSCFVDSLGPGQGTVVEWRVPITSDS